jgi:GMP synthase (glutamine-hydrolysing)
MSVAAILRHVAFEDLGTLEPALHAAGYKLHYYEAGLADPCEIDAANPELLVVLGGAIGVYETTEFPFLRDEVALIARRLQAERPVLGICLGAQLMAAALGAKVHAGLSGKEIGWSALGKRGEETLLDPLFAEGVEVLHWHGDTFELPPGARLLASSRKYPHQAFAVGSYGLALQFHAEVTAKNLERWYIGHCCELGAAGVDIPTLRADGISQAPRLAAAAARLWPSWLKSL